MNRIDVIGYTGTVRILTRVGTDEVPRSELKDKVDVANSTLSRRLNEMVEVGLLEKDAMITDDGSAVTSYRVPDGIQEGVSMMAEGLLQIRTQDVGAADADSPKEVDEDDGDGVGVE